MYNYVSIMCQLCINYVCVLHKSPPTRRTGTRMIRPGSVWTHTPVVCCAIATIPKNVIVKSKRFLDLLRANLCTPIKELRALAEYRVSESQMTRARQEIISQEKLNNPKYYRLLPLYFQRLRERHIHSMFDIEFDKAGLYQYIH